LPRSAGVSRESDAGARQDAAGATNVGTGDRSPDASVRDAAAPPMQEPPPVPNANGGSPGAAGGAGAPAPAADGGGSGGAGGAVAPADNKTALIELLNMRASMNGTDALLVRSLVVQLDTPFPANSGSLRLLLTTAVTSFGCPTRDRQACATICSYVQDTCFTCVGDQECRQQLVVVCPNALTGCLTFGL
jgi:hypothetical protein